MKDPTHFVNTTVPEPRPLTREEATAAVALALAEQAAHLRAEFQAQKYQILLSRALREGGLTSNY